MALRPTGYLLRFSLRVSIIREYPRALHYRHSVIGLIIIFSVWFGSKWLTKQNGGFWNDNFYIAALRKYTLYPH